MESTTYSGPEGIELLRDAVGWLLGRECWRGDCGYDLWLHFGPARPAFSPRLAARSLNAGVAFEQTGLLHLVTDWAGWELWLNADQAVTSEDADKDIAVALAHFSRERRPVVSAEFADQDYRLTVTFAGGYVVVITPDTDELMDDESDWWSITCESFEGSPVTQETCVDVGPRGVTIGLGD